MLAYLLIFISAFSAHRISAAQDRLHACCDQAKQIARDMSFGDRQVEQVICDQPDVGEIIKREPVLRTTLIWYFAGEGTGDRVYWNHREPKSRPADHLPAMFDSPRMVRVSNRQHFSAIDKCAMLLFELQNSAIDNEYELLATTPTEARKSRHDFAISCVRCEFAASKKTQCYFLAHPLAGANANADPAYCQLTSSGDDFASYLHWLDGRSPKAFDPRKYYRNAYDSLVPASNR